ncbi:G-alpha-domain-containing protein [Ramaria rubella]|nr:G-alpha-domain-containing protein [Ramaria rubella]
MLVTRRVSDPFVIALQPPPNESPEARNVRIAKEREAKKISDAIDEQLRQEREERKIKLRSRKEVKVLLLGQSESGKTTTLKQFQIAYAPNAFREERLAWRYVIYLNLVRSVRRITDAIFPSERDASHTGTTSVESPADESPSSDSPQSRTLPSVHPTVSESYTRTSRPTPPSTPRSSPFASPPYTDLRARLEPLILLEQKLIHQLARGDDDEATHLGLVSQPISESKTPLNSAINRSESASQGIRRSTEVSVNNRQDWKRALTRLVGVNENEPVQTDPNAGGWQADPADPAHILAQCSADIEHLWTDSAVQAELRRKRIRLEESSGFYLDSVPRITALGYMPSDDDVLKARLKTLGVVEHTFSLETGKERGFDWKIYDVGGAQNQRQAWAPYFEDMNAIIFLAPISSFDQVLAEDPRVNRLEDTLFLWRCLIANKLLANVNIVLFLNKCDLLKKKLQAGVQLRDYMTSYGERPNTYESVSKCKSQLQFGTPTIFFFQFLPCFGVGGLHLCTSFFNIFFCGIRDSHGFNTLQLRPIHLLSHTHCPFSCAYFRTKFLALNKSSSPNPQRDVYLHLTSVTDTQSTASIIGNVREIILRKALIGSKIL